MLNPRLNMIFEHINASTVADVGTDHAYIPIELMKKGKCSKIIASDISKGPAKIAEEHIKNNGLDIEVRVGPGITVLEEGEVEQIVIAGMGGKLIVDILKDSHEIAKSSKLILQPMNGQYELRKYLLENGFVITDEDIVTEGIKVYNLIETNPSGVPLRYETELDLHLPHFLENHKYYPELKAKKIREFNKIMNGHKKSALNSNAEIIKYYEFLLNEVDCQAFLFYR